MKDIEKNESEAADRIKQSYLKENARMFYSIIFSLSIGFPHNFKFRLTNS